MIDKPEEAVVAFSALGVGLWLAMSQPDKWNALKRIATARWIGGMALVALFSAGVAIWHSKNQDLVTSVKRGIMALLIAIMGEIGLTIAPFWTIFAVSYFMESWI